MEKMLNKKITHIFLAIFLALLISLAGCAGDNQGGASGKESAESGYKNDFTLESLEGEKVSLSDYAGKIVILNFWATWCPPCKAEIPDFIDVYSQYKNEGVEFVGVSTDSRAELEEFAEEYGINYTLLIDGTPDQVMREWEIRAVPTTFILDRDGGILVKNVGLMQKAQLVSEIEKRL
jgi:cytochrome c biogenesis protein CcmG/thiol:disulfide interchange protein DsbE